MNDLTDFTNEFVRDPRQLIGIPLALVGAVFLSVGAQLQHRGVTKVESRSGSSAAAGLNLKQLGALLTRPSWVTGTLLLGLAIVFQLSALWFAPLTVVQPLGALALVITAILNARVQKVKLNRASVVAIVMCVAGIGLFVGLAGAYSVETTVTNEKLITVLALLAIVIVLYAISFIFLRKRFKAVFYIIAAGVIYGFVATLAKVVLSRIQQGNFDGLTILCVVALIAGTAIGGYFVQTAYSSGPPDLVIAGLTVVDPMIAVGIGIVVLGEASQTPLWAMIGFVIAGFFAAWGVVRLARHHPQSL